MSNGDTYTTDDGEIVWPTDGNLGVMSFNGDGFTLYDEENPDSWVTADRETFVYDIEEYL